MLNPVSDTEGSALLLAKLLKFNITSSTIKREIIEHPDYPSLLSTGDVFGNYGFENLTVRFPPEKEIYDIPTPFITQINSQTNHNNYFTVVSKAKSDSVSYFDFDSNKWFKESHKDFRKKWSGIALLVEKKENSGERNYKGKRQHEQIVKISKYLIVTSIPIIVLISGIIKYIEIGRDMLSPYIFLILNLVGSVIGSFLLWYELDQDNPLMKQICSNGPRINCSAVLRSKGSKIFK